MTIPGHAPRPRSPHTTRRHGPTQRDAGLDRISQLTKWTLAGGLVVTGGFTLFGTVAQAEQTQTRSPASFAPVTFPPQAASSPTVPAETVPPTTVLPTRATPLSTLPPQPVYVQPQPVYRPPVRTYSPPLVTSGGS